MSEDRAKMKGCRDPRRRDRRRQPGAVPPVGRDAPFVGTFAVDDPIAATVPDAGRTRRQ
jgi:hypothetical protein